MQREQIDFDVLFVGGGPACLAGAIRLMQLAGERNMDLQVAIIEKGAEVGAHAVSGAILNPVALAELIPDFQEKGCPVETMVHDDGFYFLTKHAAYRLPTTPRDMRNQGCLVISQSRFVRWLAGIAEDMGVNIFPGFAGTQVLYGTDGKTVVGVRTGDKGLDPDETPKGNFEPGIDLMAKITVFGEGARGSLMAQMAHDLNLFSAKMPQIFETGIKEVIQLPEARGFAGGTVNDIHTMGYPLGLDVPGGGFIYQMRDNRVALGYLVGLGYPDPMTDPYELLIRFKHHPFVARLIQGGKVLEQGARTVSTGGFYTMPQLAVAGALFVGGAAAMHNTPALKGIHVSMKSGMLAAEAAVAALAAEDVSQSRLSAYQSLFDTSWLKSEMVRGRNFAQALAKTGPAKWIHIGAQYISHGRGICDRMPIEADALTLKPVTTEPAPLPRDLYDGLLFVDKLTGVYLSKTSHREDQPCHIKVHDTNLCVTTCFDTYRCPCTRFCPGAVYEIELDETTGDRRLKLNASNCLHCKTCDIKDPYGNITWNCPEGGQGPSYSMV